jgi:hypothetical protein
VPIGRTPRDWPVDDIRRWIEEEGVTHEEAGQRLGCAAQTIGKLCAKHGIRSQRRGPRGGPGHPNWRGGRRLDKDGYVMVWVADHPNPRRPAGRKSGGYVLEHRLVMEAHLGRHLEPHEVVHHKNGVHTDNRLENLELFQTNADHLRHELTGRVPNWTEAGRERIREGVRRRWSKSRQPAAPGEPESQ